MGSASARRATKEGGIVTITFKDWIIKDKGLQVSQYDNLSCRLEVLGSLPEGWDWAMLVQAEEKLDIIPLTPMEGGVGADLTRDQLAVGDSCYLMQLRGTRGDVVRHTNIIQVFVAKSLSGDGQWPTVPTEFTQLEQRMLELNSHPPIPGQGGVWLLWDVEEDQYKESDLPLPDGAGMGAAVKGGLALVARLLRKGVYTGDVSALLTELELILEGSDTGGDDTGGDDTGGDDTGGDDTGGDDTGGDDTGGDDTGGDNTSGDNTGGDDTGGDDTGGNDTGGDDTGGDDTGDDNTGGSEEPVVTAETMTFAREVDRYPNITTFAYTLTETGGWPLVLPSTIGGGTLSVTFDENRFANFQGIFYLFDKDGAPYKLGIGTGPNNSNGRPTVSGASTIKWSEPGKAPGWTGISASFTCEIPEGCNVMIAFQPTGGTSADGTVTGNNFTNEIVDNGFIQAKITKEG